LIFINAMQRKAQETGDPVGACLRCQRQKRSQGRNTMNDQISNKSGRSGVSARILPSMRMRSASVRDALLGNIWTVGGLLSLLLLAAVATMFWWISRGHAGVQYSTVPVTRGPIVRTVTATGTVNPVLTIIVGSSVSGVIQELYCDYNTEVKQGQICAKIDPRAYQSLVDQNKANLAVARAQLAKDKANLAYMQRNYERNAQLGKTQAVSQDAVDNAKSGYDQAQAQVEYDQATIDQRQAELDAAQVNLDYTSIVSPVHGTVVSRNVTMGQTVAASFQTPTLFLIATDLTKMQVDTNVSESDIGGIKENNRATFSVDAFPKRSFEGVVTQVRQSPQTVQNVVTFDVVVSFDNTDLSLKPGMTASTKIVVDERNDAIRVPDQALRYMPTAMAAVPSPGDEARVWILSDDQPRAIAVVLGLDDDSFTEVAKGDIKPGDRVIVSEQRGSSGGQPAVPLPRF
jgi:HlyD family secretion protein